jgi:hypothetical protein
MAVNLGIAIMQVLTHATFALPTLGVIIGLALLGLGVARKVGGTERKATEESAKRM